MATRTDYAVCMLCEAICGIAVEHDGQKVHRIRGDAEDPFSWGHLCPKGVALADVQNDPERIRRPLRRRRGAGGASACPTSHSDSAVLFISLLKDQLGTRNFFSASPVDTLPRTLVAATLYRNQAVLRSRSRPRIRARA